jgi:cold shock protein
MAGIFLYAVRRISIDPGRVLMPNGMVKWFNEQKNYGFIIPDDGGRDLFFHRSDMQSSLLREGQLVTFGIEEGRKGPVAINVTPCDGEGNVLADKWQTAEHPEPYARSGPAYPDTRSGSRFQPPYNENIPKAKTGGRIAGLIAEAMSICDAADDLAARAGNEGDGEARRNLALNLSVLIRTAREKLDDAMDEFYGRGK